MVGGDLYIDYLLVKTLNPPDMQIVRVALPTTRVSLW
jgi:hypothetical protein